MTHDPAWMHAYRADHTSQTGEDGVISAALELLPRRDGWCVEFGALDGRLFSNTRYLIEHRGYAAVLIEGDRARFGELERTCRGDRQTIPIHATVGFTTRDSLDALLARHPIPADFDFLSIDIDGNDYHVWKATQRYRPKLVCVEFNPTIPTEARFVQAADHRVTQGASLLSLVELGRSKGYELVAVLPWNAFFVDAPYFPAFEIDDNRPALLRRDTELVTHIFSGYDGTIFLGGAALLPWHHVALDAARMQRLPGVLRKYPGNYNLLEKALYYGYLAVHAPDVFKRWLAGVLRR